MNYTQNRRIEQMTETTLVVGRISEAGGIMRERLTGEALRAHTKHSDLAMIWTDI